jgi:rRNA-processing protein CGR1
MGMNTFEFIFSIMSEELIPLTSSSHGRVSGKSWKAQKSATLYVLYYTPCGLKIIQKFSRTQCSAGHRSNFEERMKKTTKANAAKKLETELKTEKNAEKQR